ncbi:hypothetical protein BH11PLA2_BH11PLA2_49570 [soil metagenome]
MRLISPDILTASAGLSLGASGFAFFVGLLLWACGWRWHKFWVVFGITTAAGMIGLTAGQAAGGQVLVLGVLLAFAGGVMALEVAKILAFAGGGLAAWLAVQTVLPQAHEMWAVFLSGGLFGVLLYKLWTMLLTSFVGVLVASHAALVVMIESGSLTTKFAIENTAALNGAVLVMTVVGAIVQAIVAKGAAAEAHEEEDEEPSTVAWWKKFPSMMKAA